MDALAEPRATRDSQALLPPVPRSHGHFCVVMERGSLVSGSAIACINFISRHVFLPHAPFLVLKANVF